MTGSYANDLKQHYDRDNTNNTNHACDDVFAGVFKQMDAMKSKTRKTDNTAIYATKYGRGRLHLQNKRRTKIATTNNIRR